MTTPIYLSQLPAPDVVESLDFETILAERKAALIDLYPADGQAAIAETLELESEPLTKMLQENAYRELILRQRVNEAAKATMLAYARKADLDQIGARYDVFRLTLDEGDPDAMPPVAATYESDSDFRRRIQLSFEGFSTAGPASAYQVHALGADARVLDASVTSPAPGDVTVTILARDGNGEAPADLVVAVQAALDADDVRPLTDRVTVASAEILPFTVDATLIIYPGPDGSTVRDTAEQQLADYLAARRRLGQDVTLSGLYAALHVAGVQNVALASPTADIVATPQQAAHATAINVTLGGVDE